MGGRRNPNPRARATGGAMDPSKLGEVRSFVEACKKDPALLADPSLAFFRDYLQSATAAAASSAKPAPKVWRREHEGETLLSNVSITNQRPKPSARVGTEFPGVRWEKSGRYSANVKAKKQIAVGTFDTIEEAVEAREEVVLKLRLKAKKHKAKLQKVKQMVTISKDDTVEQCTSDYDKEKIAQERLAKLSGGATVLKIGGASEAEVGEKKDRVTDALNATKAAVEEGIVPDGGVALLYASKDLDKLPRANFDQKIGVQIIQNALKTPVHTIATNAGVEGDVIVGKLLEQENTDLGYDAAKGEYVDMVKEHESQPEKQQNKLLWSGGMIQRASRLLKELQEVKLPPPCAWEEAMSE